MQMIMKEMKMKIEIVKRNALILKINKIQYILKKKLYYYLNLLVFFFSLYQYILKDFYIKFV